MAKLRARKAPVYKVVYCEGDGRLVSAIVRKGHPIERYAKAARWQERTYRDAAGRLRTVRQSIAFETARAARRYARGREEQVWEAQCARAKPITSVVDLDGYSFTRKSFRLFAALWGEPDGWTEHEGVVTAGSLLCENLRLVRRLEP